MATADEILQEMAEQDEYPVLVIDNDMRQIEIPDDVKILGVESDDDVHRIHFRMPRMCGEFDLSAFALRVNILNAQNEGDLYEVTDKAVEGDVISFSWLVGRTAAKYKGDVKFNVCAKLMAKDGTVEKEFNTTVATLPVLEGLEVSEAIVQLHPDVIEGMLARISALETSGGVTDEQIANALNAYLQEHPVEAGATKEQAEQIAANAKAIEELQKSGAGQPGQPGEDGKDGVSPTVTITQIAGGNRVTITDVNGAKSFDIMNGTDGEDGDPGANGVSPTISVSVITGGHRITITDANGTQYFDVMDGASGSGEGGGGAPGKDGVSPTVTITPITGGNRVTFTDVNGAKSFDVMNGTDGEPGDPGAAGGPGPAGADGRDGVSPTVTITPITGGNRVTITDVNGAKSFDVMNGADGEPGAAAEVIDDSAPAADKTYSSQKIEAELAQLNQAIDAKVGTDQLNTAVENALTDAKNSGEFKGDPGEPGTPGYTPVKGTDYWTAADKQGIVSDVLAALPNASGVSF